ncbi:MAG TPA: DUF2155 domain-containing protein [Aestuariivirgaceae bacterium]|nr:DUF2155 domain-containing protein [Aestuariivirgaceae bacterium]
MRADSSFAAMAALLAGLAGPAGAESIRNPIAVFAGLDKITGTITRFEVTIDEIHKFGSLDVLARVCNTRPVTEQPKTMAFVEVEEALPDGGTTRVFTGWMLAESPGLNAVEHPVYDVWLTNCRDPDAPALVQEALPETLDLDSMEIPKDND